MSGKYSGGMGLKSLSSKEPSPAEPGVRFIILESQHNSAVSKCLRRPVAKRSSYSPLVTGSHKEWKFTAAVNGNGYGVSMIIENGIRS